MSLRLGVLTSHPIQYQAPLFRELAQRFDLEVFFAHLQTAAEHSDAGFNAEFEWDIDLLGGYRHRFLRNQARRPDVSRFLGCDTPEIGRIIRNETFDVFLIMGWYLKSYLQGLWACKRTGVKVISHGDSRLATKRSFAKNALKEIGYPILLRQFDACLYVGKDSREYLKHYGVPNLRLFFAPHCVDTQWFSSRAFSLDKSQAKKRLGLNPNKPVVLFVGKLVETKRPGDLIRAAGLLERNSVGHQLVMAGDGRLRPELEALAYDQEVSLTMLGFCNQTELPFIYRAADVLVLPSSETWGLVVNEAQACGVPVLLSDEVGCAKDLVRDVSTGRIFSMGDVPGLAEALRAVLEDAVDSASIAEMTRRHSIAATADGIERAVQSLMETEKAKAEDTSLS